MDDSGIANSIYVFPEDLSFTVIPIAILYYDYCLTLDAEAEVFWNDFKLTWASVLFMMNRYLALLFSAPILVEAFAELSETMSPTTTIPWIPGPSNTGPYFSFAICTHLCAVS
ncbi:hypothetical protein CERSUDRAFT_122659 [Gelatoporia subvermispora B]|uniref:DUF6533 domain-containing protein n=1 Tax=Ceriporiopsis subvermispora (strain B) TaxID=914234 RepID=M2RL80_CERS8|nr:hypothetical protein CERSUDRAFT_122659 [Gelatoporia subvermispora B]